MSNKKEKYLSYLVGAYMESLEASSMILQLVESEFAKVGAGLQQRAKQRNKQIQMHLQALRNLTADDMFANEHQAFASSWNNYDNFRRDAAYLARLVLLITDRTYLANNELAIIENFIRMRPQRGLISNDVVNKLIIV